VYVRLAQFEGDPGEIDQMVAGIRENLAATPLPAWTEFSV
jgi:hypothetical protein